MGYLGNTPTTQSFSSGTDYFNGNGSTTAFTLSRQVASVNDIEVFVNNVSQAPNSGYTLSGNTLTFDAAPSSGTNNIYVRYLSTTTVSPAPPYSPTILGNLTLSTTGARIFGDFSNATISNRLSFQSITTNSNTAVHALPNGTATSSGFGGFNSSDVANAGRWYINATGTEVNFSSDKTGTGSYLPLNMYTGGSARLSIDTSGNVGIATNSPSSFGKFAVQGASTNRVFYADSLAQPVARYDDNSFVSNGLTIRNSGVTGSNQGIGLQFQLGASGTPVTAGVIQMRSEGDFSTAATQDAAMIFGTCLDGSATERMRIDSSGNVGIGTSSPDIYSQGGKMFTVSNTATNSYAWATLAGSGTGGGEIDLGNQTIRHAAIASLSGSALAFYTNTTNTGTGVSEKMRINAYGNIALYGGTTSANGVGVTFPATQSASSDANCLDDYEEGTWTPSMTASGTAPTGVTYDIYRYGRYTKIGRIVYIRATIVMTSKGTGGVGDVIITGLPFSPGDYNGYAYSPLSVFYYQSGGITGTVIASLYDNSTNIYLGTPGNANNLIQWSTISGTEKISIAGVYQT